MPIRRLASHLAELDAKWCILVQKRALVGVLGSVRGVTRNLLRLHELATVCILIHNSGRADSNRRRPAWEAGILPLNYARVSDCR